MAALALARVGTVLLAPGAGAEALAQARKLVGPLPEELEQLLKINDGEREVGGLLGGYVLLGCASLGSEWEQLQELHAQGLLGEWSSRWLPFASDFGGNFLLIDADSGAVFERDHETTEMLQRAESLRAYLEELARELNDGLWSWKDDDGEHWLTRAGDTKDEDGAWLVGQPQSVLEAADQRLSVAPSWTERDEILVRVTAALRLDAAEWLTRHWDDPELSNGARIQSAAAVFPPRRAVELALTRYGGRVELLEPVASAALLDHLERSPPEIAAREWGPVVAASRPRWARLEGWLTRGRPLSLIALDAILVATTNLLPFETRSGKARPKAEWLLEDAPAVEKLKARLEAFAASDGSARVKKTIAVLLPALK
ncbi:MAG: SMI1/KNR4 family protein [Myxococcales bacterium]|nr:SMI1/KNR4 family protein [Myxococcales bacterium]MCB9581289.1 SMI1/KNR4 family protein [Polyangiaceae bacterium]